MKVLIVKTSSMGDIIHTLPALTDAGKAIPSIRFDWLVEENFAEIPAWHPLVDNVIPVAIRRWRKNLFSKQVRTEIRALHTLLREKQYDLVIDAQGLLKSAILTRFAKGLRCGLDWSSSRGKFAAIFYQKTFTVSLQQHAVIRVRSLFSQALGYPLPDTVADYGVNRKIFFDENCQRENYLVFLHGTTWETKHWPESYWCALANIANENGLQIKLPWGNAEEQQRALRIAASCKQAEVLPRQDLRGMAKVLANAKAIVAVDTGLGHLAAALDVPTVSLYGPTDPQLTGAVGKSQLHLAAQFSCAPCLNRKCTYAAPSSIQPPCFADINPEKVWGELKIRLF